MSSGTAKSSVEILRMVFEQNPHLNQKRTRKILQYCKALYRGVEHPTCGTVYRHCLEVLAVMSPLQPDQEAIDGCLLHHVYMADVPIEQVEQDLNVSIQALSNDLQMISQVTLKPKRSKLNIMKMALIQAAKDDRTLLIALCDYVHNMEHIPDFSETKKRQVSLYALHLFAPIASRLGMYTLKKQLEQAAFPIIYPNDFQRISVETKATNSSFLKKTKKDIIHALQQVGITANVEYRVKEPYSLFLKMNARSYTSIEQVFDLFALRIIVEELDDCYKAISLMNTLGTVVEDRFKDYIHFPKPNGYQSLHTTMQLLPHVPPQYFVEVQVRTVKMDHQARYGASSHWGYKEVGSEMAHEHTDDIQRLLLETPEGQTVQNVSRGSIYVLTPEHDVIELPEKSTPLDFAFAVHSDLGIHYRSSMVNGVVAKIDQRLENGDVVSITKGNSSEATGHWLSHLHARSARNKLRKYLDIKNRGSHLVQGREKINDFFKKHHRPPLTKSLQALAMIDGQRLPFGKREEIVIKVGKGVLKPHLLWQQLTKEKPSLLKRITKPLRRKKELRLLFDDGIPMPHVSAKCCKPTAPTEITGIINREGMVRVHAQDCLMITASDPNRHIGVYWG
jgi:GTP pyrophosphokinase